MSLRGRSAALVALAALALGVSAYVPPASRIANAVADTNRGAQRNVALSVEVALELGGDGNVVATGTLVSGPSADARIELRSPRGTLERHLRRGDALRATREGAPVERPRPFLPPVYLLQAGDVPKLVRSLSETGIRPDRIGLGYDGDHNCFVLGERQPGRGALYVDQETLDVVRVDLPDGSRFRFGPPARFGRLQLPSWIEVSLADRRLGRLIVKSASPLPPDPARFDPTWLQ